MTVSFQIIYFFLSYACLRTKNILCKAVKLAKMAMNHTAQMGRLNSNSGPSTKDR